MFPLEVLKNFTLQIIFVFGFIVIFGLALWWLSRRFFRMLGYKRGRKAVIATGFIGVPIHELGHAFFCIIFWHKIKAVKFFQPNPTDGILGYVRHEYNPRNTYQQIGNFFIGIGPILFGSLAIMLLSWILLPLSFVEAAGGDLWRVFLVVFSPANAINPWWWVFMVLAISITLHMSLSPADIRGSIKGFIYMAIILLILNIILCLINFNAAAKVTEWCMTIGLFMASFLTTAVIILTATVGVTALTKLIHRKVTGRISTPSADIGFFGDYLGKGKTNNKTDTPTTEASPAPDNTPSGLTEVFHAEAAHNDKSDNC
jgi:hypothetical protein